METSFSNLNLWNVLNFILTTTFFVFLFLRKISIKKEIIIAVILGFPIYIAINFLFSDLAMQDRVKVYHLLLLIETVIFWSILSLIIFLKNERIKLILSILILILFVYLITQYTLFYIRNINNGVFWQLNNILSNIGLIIKLISATYLVIFIGRKLTSLNDNLENTNLKENHGKMDNKIQVEANNQYIEDNMEIPTENSFQDKSELKPKNVAAAGECIQNAILFQVLSFLCYLGFIIIFFKTLLFNILPVLIKGRSWDSIIDGNIATSIFFTIVLSILGFVFWVKSLTKFNKAGYLLKTAAKN